MAALLPGQGRCDGRGPRRLREDDSSPSRPVPASRSRDVDAPLGGDPYAVLGLTPQATSAEIKAAYRALVKCHHPDAGGDEERIVALNAAWEVLRDEQSRRRYDAAQEASRRPPAAGDGLARPMQARRGAAADAQLLAWLQKVYAPIDRLLAQVINPFPQQLRELSADPYDDRLMEAFCTFLEQSRARLEKVDQLYRSMAAPASAQGFSLSLYHCLSQVQDALIELERYTMGYVDSYLRDGREMLREAKRRRTLLHQERSRLGI
jgi:molecular chaperone DnaJ